MTTPSPPAILHLEDSDLDADVIRRRLTAAGLAGDIDRAATRAEFAARLAARPYALILSDYKLGGPDAAAGFDGAAALELARELQPGVPFIYLSGVIGEEAAIESLKAGATDYVLKHRLDRLGPAATRALAEAGAIAAKDRAESSLRASEEHLRATLASIGDGVISTDPAGRVTMMNPVAEALTGWPAAAAAGRPLADVFRIVDEAGDAIENPVEAAPRTGGVINLPAHTTLISRDGTERPIEDSAAPIRDAAGNVSGAVIVFRDVSDRKRAEAALAAVNTLVRDREARLAQLNEQLRDQDRRKDEFLAVLAHELRNPLAPVRNGLQILKLGPPPDVARKARDMMDRQVTHIVRLVDDLLDVSRITRGKLELKTARVDLRAVLESAVETSRPALEAARHTFTFTPPAGPVPLDADLVRLAQVFMNLLTNAAKYTPDGGHVSLTAERKGPVVEVVVKDDGVGIPAAVLPTVFDMFTQADRTLDRAQGGLGIGLTLVRRLTELHGGAVTAASDGPGKGSTFTVRIPVAGAAPPAAGPPAPAAAARPGLSILVVDDNEDAADSLATLLEIGGHRTRQAHTGPAAVAAAAAFRPDVIFLDIGLPGGMTGYDVARAVRATPGGAAVKIVALTGWGSEDDRRASREAGFDAHLTKPVAAADVQRVLAGGK